MTVGTERLQERPPRLVRCKQCGATASGRFCNQCGNPLFGDAPLLRPLNPTLAFSLELVGGWLGFLGIGWIYAGRIGRGALNLIGWWFSIITLWFIFIALVIAGVDVGLLLLAMFVIWAAVPLLSALQVKRYFRRY